MEEGTGICAENVETFPGVAGVWALLRAETVQGVGGYGGLVLGLQSLGVFAVWACCWGPRAWSLCGGAGRVGLY